MRLTGERIYLRPLIVDDASEQYSSWINNQEVNKYLESKRITIKDLKTYIDTRSNDPNCLFLGIFLNDDNFHIGNIKLEPINFKNKIATFGILIGEKRVWNMGYGTEALRLLLDYSKKELKLGEINLGVYKKNSSAIKLYKKCGFKVYEEEEKSYKMRVILN